MKPISGAGTSQMPIVNNTRASGAAKDFIPSVTRQGYDVRFIDNESLCGSYGSPRFNGSIIRYNGRLLVAYRYYGGNINKSHLAISELDDDLAVKSNHPLNIRAHGTTKSYIDPRLFIHNDKLWITFAEFDMGNRGMYRCIVRCVQLGDGYIPENDLEIKYGDNYKALEKNWCFFSHDDELWFYYSILDQRCVRVCDTTGRMIEERRSGPFTWLLDHLRGGTPFAPYGDGYISFYHSGTKHPWYQRRYGVGAVVIEGKPPFGIKKLGLPFMYGSREDLFIDRDRPGNPNVVFAAGLVDCGDHFLVSVGVNDSINAVITVPKDNLEATLEPFEAFKKDRGKFFAIRNGKGVMTLWGMELVGELVKVSGMNCPTHYLNTEDPVTLEFAKNASFVSEISPEEYHKKLKSRTRKGSFQRRGNVV